MKTVKLMTATMNGHLIRKKGRPECNYQYFEDKWMRGTIDTDEFILALGTIDLGELPPPQKNQSVMFHH